MNGNRNEVSIRTELRPGDLGLVLFRHGALYAQESGFTLRFEAYVAKTIAEFAECYDPATDRVWVCEHGERMVGFLLAMKRGEGEAQLRYFLVEPEFRGAGLGRKLLGLFLGFMREKGYTKAYLWTTNEQEKAIGLYESIGFRLAEEKASEAFGRSLVERRYDLDLADALTDAR
jgi:Acetyltransferases